jgi:hypothetical protein
MQPDSTLISSKILVIYYSPPVRQLVGPCTLEKLHPRRPQILPAAQLSIPNISAIIPPDCMLYIYLTWYSKSLRTPRRCFPSSLHKRECASSCRISVDAWPDRERTSVVHRKHTCARLRKNCGQQKQDFREHGGSEEYGNDGSTNCACLPAYNHGSRCLVFLELQQMTRRAVYACMLKP